MKKILFFIFVCLALKTIYSKDEDIPWTTVWCGGQLCQYNCTKEFLRFNCEICNSTVCSTDDGCTCATSRIPGKLELESTPQFVTLSFDGPVTHEFFERTKIIDRVFRNGSIFDKNKCQPKPSFFIQNDGTDYPYVTYLGLAGSIGLYSITGKLNYNSTKLHWIKEYENGAKWINLYGKTNYTFRMSRAMNSVCPNYYNMMKELQLNVDSSLKENPKTRTIVNKQMMWPYTLDYGYHGQGFCENSTTCPTSPGKGIWEFVEPILYDSDGNDFPLEWVNEKNYSTALKILKTNFDEVYKNNRAPFGLSLKPDWFYDGAFIDEVRMNFLTEAYAYMGNQKNSLFAGQDDIVDWIKKPVPFNVTSNQTAFTCAFNYSMLDAYYFGNKGRSPRLCDYPTSKGSFYVNDLVCPDYYPNISNTFCEKETGEFVCHYGVDDCNCDACNSDCNQAWAGDVFWNFTKEWDTGVCGVIIFANRLNIIPRSAVITLRLYNSHISSLWGANRIRVASNETFKCNSETWRILPGIFDFEYNKPYGHIGICLRKGPFWNREFVRLGIEFSEEYPKYTKMENIKIKKCGDGKCDDKENGKLNYSLLCACDCLPNSINFVLFAEKLQSIVILIGIIIYLSVGII